MTRNLQFLIFVFLAAVTGIFSACSDEESRPTFPLSAEVFYSVDGKQVAFTALTHSAESWFWDFGDGNTTTEQSPVHVYEAGGEYFVTLTAKDSNGEEVSKQVRVAIALTPYAMLVGNHTVDGYEGKKWRLSPEHDPLDDRFADADADFTVLQDMSHGILSNIGFGAAYEDEFTFHYDQSFAMDMKSDGASFGGVLYQMVLNGGANVIHANLDFGLALAKFTPETDATFTFTEGEDVAVQTIHGELNFEDVMTLDFSGTAYLGFRDFQQKVIVTSLSDSRMQIIAFMAADQTKIGVNSHALFLTLEAVN